MIDGQLIFPVIPRKLLIGQGIGEYPGQRRGQGKDFIDKRPYRPSDPVRYIDWKETARRSMQYVKFSPYVREFREDEMIRAVIIVDRSSRMAWYPKPWLSKPQVIVSAGQMIVDSLKKYHGLIGYLDFARWPETKTPFWRPPNQETEALRVRNRNLNYQRFEAPENNLDMALEWLWIVKEQIPPESFIFILSDFLVMPEYELLEATISRWDVVPVIIQDPLLEASFPVWRGKIPVCIPFILPNGKVGFKLFSEKEAKRTKQEHENRFRDIISLFETLSLHPVVLFEAEPEKIYSAFCEWGYTRMGGR